MTVKVYIDKDLEDLIPGFLENRLSDLKNLKEALIKEDYENIRFISHSLKGVAGGYGFDEITKIGLQIEESAKSLKKEEIQKKLELFEHYLEELEIEYISIE